MLLVALEAQAGLADQDLLGVLSVVPSLVQLSVKRPHTHHDGRVEITEDLCFKFSGNSHLMWTPISFLFLKIYIENYVVV